MISGFKGNVFQKYKNWIYLRNSNNVYQIYSYQPEVFNFSEEQIWVFTCLFKQLGYKNIEKRVLFGFLDLNEAIYFEELMGIDGIGLKTSFKILRNDLNLFRKLVNENNQYELINEFNLSQKQVNAILNHFNEEAKFELNQKELNVLNEIINQLQEIGYSKKIVEEIVFKNREKIIKNPNVDCFPYLIKEIQNARL